MEHSKKLMLVPEERLRKFAEDRLSTLDKQMYVILSKEKYHGRRKSISLTYKFFSVNFSYPSKHPDILQTVDTKQENYQNQSTETVEDNTITSISPKEHV
ncbi:uncharacterized protein TNIN_373951 [Trichonephila inaurata madagascariensis]|uniref:Uncharacterized protein n=1 Tax=Trichonephila inaurata madagascariensis TaxID=2747483 RepID=A0A8X6ISY7_9ARAC|nr:uncharacterized protein TNIN_373951 [Trichonephila inaurata madagascariensis]